MNRADILLRFLFFLSDFLPPSSTQCSSPSFPLLLNTSESSRLSPSLGPPARSFPRTLPASPCLIGRWALKGRFPRGAHGSTSALPQSCHCSHHSLGWLLYSLHTPTNDSHAVISSSSTPGNTGSWHYFLHAHNLVSKIRLGLLPLTTRQVTFHDD